MMFMMMMMIMTGKSETKQKLCVVNQSSSINFVFQFPAVDVNSGSCSNAVDPQSGILAVGLY